ncbi:MAG: chitobiase/beta-hexosaminidase C-terminal domain-containing protein, partial [Verrucomicrobiales bacterium]
MKSSICHLAAIGAAVVFSYLASSANAALLIHYSFDSEATGSLANGATVTNAGTTTTNGTAGVPGGSLTVKDDVNRPNGASGLLGNYLDIQPSADNAEGTGAAHINSGSSLSSLGIDGNSDFTMMAWVKFDNATNDNMLFGGNAGSVIHYGARGGDYWSGHWGDDINSGGSPGIDVGNWHHVTWTNTGTTQEIFIDGVSSVVGGGGSDGGFSSNLAENLLIGTSRNQGSFRGKVDDVGVFTGSLNQYEVAAFYTLATDTDYGYDVGEVNQLVDAHNAGAGSSATIDGTTWEYVASDPGDGRFFVLLAAGGSGIAGSTGPPVYEFVVDHPVIPSGNAIVLSWNVGSNATSLSIDQGIGNVLPLTTNGIGQITINSGPTTATTYTLSASNANGGNTGQVSVTITNQPIIESFAADQTIVAPGTSVQLDWAVLNVSSLDLNGSSVTGTTSTTVNPTATTTYTLTATNGQGSTDEQVAVTVIIPGEPVINEISADNQLTLLDEDGESKDWIELHNPSASTAILNDYYLSDDPDLPTKWRLPNMTLAPGDFLIVFASGKDRAVAGSELHTNFSLRANGEYLALSKVDGGVTTILSEYDPYPNQFEDITWGLFPDGTTLGYFTSPTPGSANSTGLVDYVRDTSFSPKRGFYTAPISVAITSNTPDVQIRYTTDGSAPTTTSGMLYSEPIAISSTTVLRAMAYRVGYIPTNVDTHTYL